ncbi:MAG: FHA domain-containing protein [Planctomycetes bacterium]|nr:FHA domain-containing protein [Planctomycetota bacterium]
MSRVEIYRNGTKEGELPLQPRMRIGRIDKNEIQIESSKISRHHAEIFQQGEQYWVRDSGSTNGTFVNGERVPEGGQRLSSGDGITLGDFVVRFVLDVAEEEVPERTLELPVEAVSRAEPAPEPESPASPPEPIVDERPEASPLMEHLLDRRHPIPVWCAENRKDDVELKLVDIVDEAPDVKTFRFVGIQPLLFSYQPGQFLTLILDIDGQSVKRSYSMSSSPSRPHTLEITVKRVPGGLVSNHLQDNLKLGQVIRARGPSGKFTCFSYPSSKMLFIGAGSGCTPLMSMARWIVDTNADVDVKYLVSARNPEDIIFSQELEYLSARHSGFEAAATVTGQASGSGRWLGYRGRLCAPMLQLFAPDLMERHVYMCGPDGFMDAVRDCLKSIGFDMSRLHTESFGGKRVAKGTKVEPRDAAKHDSTMTPQARAVQLANESAVAEAVASTGARIEPASMQLRKPVEAPPAASSDLFRVSFVHEGVEVETDGESNLLEIAEANGLEIDYECRVGSCGTCRVKCDGEVEMDDDAGLEDDDRKAGYVLACTACPRGHVKIEIPEA